MYDYDLIVLGGGPGGYVAAIKAAQSGLKTCLIEKDRVGGVCLNRGCIPTKTLLKSAEVYRTVREAAAFGVLGVDSSAVRVDMQEVQKRKNQVVKKLTGGVSLLLKANGITLLTGEGRFLDSHTLQVGDKQVSADYIIIATGSSPAALPAETDPAAQVIGSDEALELESLPESIVIIGGGVIGIEFAYLLNILGVDVTVLEFLPTILSMLDQEVSTAVTAALRKAGVKIHTSAKVTAVAADRVCYELDGKSESVPASLVLSATGRRANLTGYGLENTGVQTGASGIVTDEHLRTNVPHLYAIGDVNGKAMLAHTASGEALAAVADICGRPAGMDYRAIPNCIYLHPEIAAVGLNETEARQRYGQVLVGRFPLSANGKATVEGENEGFIKVIVKASDHQLLGAHLWCSRATDMIGGFAALIKAEAVADDLIAAVFPHPTVSEIIPEAFHSAFGKPIHSL